MDQYFLSDEPSKFLMTQHYHSSLNQPNLDNVQAKLHATRQRNHELAMQYFQNKYGTTEAYEQIAKTHNLGELKSINSQADNLRMHLQRKAREIKQRQGKKLQTPQHQGSINEEIEQQQFDFKSGQRKITSKQKHRKNNPWIKQRKTGHTQKNSEVENIVIDSTKNYQENIEGEFIHEFKNYLINKSKFNNQSQVKDTEMISQTINAQSGNFSESKIVTNLQLSKIQQKPKPEQAKQRKYEEQLAKKVFKDMIGQTKDHSKVEKLELVEYLVKNKKILKVLDLNQQSLSQHLLSEHPTNQQTEITLQQFLFFILKTVGKEGQINQIIQDKREKNIPQGCVLDKDMIVHFQEIFKELDRHTDLIVKRLQYTEKLANDPLIRKKVDLPAVYEEDLDKLVSLRRILERIELETILGSEEQQKVKEYISWSQFLNYFKSGQHTRGNYDLMLLVNSLREQEKFGLLEFPDAIMDIILWAIKKKDKGNHFFNTYQLIQLISQHPQFQHEKYGLARQESKISNLPTQTFQQVLSRIKMGAPKHLTIKEFFEYFSSRGRLMEQMNQTKEQNFAKNFSGAKVKFAQGEFTGKKNQIDGYDSDPEMYNSQAVSNSPRRTARSAKKLSGVSKQPLSQSMQREQFQIMRKQFKVTVPVPFSFEQRQKNRQKKQITENSANDFKQFKAKPVPNKVRDKSLYDKMLEEDRKRIDQRKKNNMIITLANQQPFSFLERKTNKKTREEREQFKFKAKPIPWYCSVDLLDKKREAELVRNEKIAKQAQESLAKAKLPPRMERDFQEKLAAKAQAPNSVQKKDKKNTLYRDPPDFDKIHRQFQQGLQRKRKQNKVTQPQEFNFTKRPESKSKIVMGLQSQISNFAHNLRTGEQYKKHLQSKPAANSTLKYTQQVEKKRVQLQKKRAEQDRKRRQDEERARIKDEQLKKRVQLLAKTQERSQKKQRQKRQKELEDLRVRHSEWKKERIEKGRQQPMLVERPLKRDEKIEKMKKLAQISKTLKQNGIKGKQHDSYFKKEELLLLQDWQQLKDRIK